MSTLKVNKIENTATTNGGVQIDVDGHVTVDGQQLPTTGPLSNRSLVINGAMQVAQRRTTETKTQYSGYPVCDRWRAQLDNASQATFTQETSGGPSGFPTFFKWNVDSVDSSIATASNVYLNQRIEGLNLQSLGYGTASAKSMTMSFYVKSNRTGTYVLEIANPAGSRHIAKTYTIDSADTWEYKTIVFPGDTTQSVANNTNEGFRIKWWLQAGTNFTSGTLATTWAAQSNPNSAAGQSVNLHDDAGANWNITGVQLEVGSKSTPFEHRSYSDELQRCQRYFQHSFTGAPSTTNTDHTGVMHAGGGNTSSTTGFLGTAMVRFSPNMRTTPTTVAYDLASPRNINKCHRHIYGQAGTNNQSVSMSDINDKGFAVRSDSGVSATGIIFHYTADAEL
jgi:hypothetical protein